MTVRTSMTSLITKLRQMSNDTDSALFTDQELQDVLDQNAYVAEYEPLNTLSTILPGGVVEYKEFQADHLFFEDDTILTDATFTEVTPDTTDYNLAYFTFTTTQTIPLLIYGWYYDMNNSAAEIWELKSAKYADTFDFSVDGGQYQLSQKQGAAMAQAVWRRYAPGWNNGCSRTLRSRK